MNFKLKFLHLDNAYYLISLPLFFVWHGFNNNESLIAVNEAVLLFFKYLVSFLLIFLLVSKTLGNSEKASLFTGYLMVLFFFFGWAHDLLKYYFSTALITRYSMILPILVITTLIIYWLIKKTNRSFHRLSVYLNLLIFIFILLEVGYSLKNHGAKNDTLLVKQPIISGKKPDVYFIIADGYGGQTELKDILDFDNSGFLNQLKSRGFHIISHSKSNYNLTPYSLASTLKMNYLNLNSIEENQEDLNTCFANINSNSVIDFFKSLNYQFFNFSIFRFNNKPPLANSQFIQVGSGIIHSQTLFGRIEKDIAFNLITKFKFKWAMRLAVEKEVHKTELLYQNTIALAKQTHAQPRFVYTHLMMPHYPYYLDSAGNFNDYNFILEVNWSSKAKYLEYLKYCNNKLIKMLDHIITNSMQPPIIILMGDHGFREFTSNADFKKYYFINLNAIYLPTKNYACLKDDLSNVNQFRCVLKTEFNQKLELITDSSILIN